MTTVLPRPARHRLAGAAVIAVIALVSLSGCNLGSFTASNDAPKVTAKPTPSPTPTFDSQFTRDGTFQSHVDIDGLDFVYNMYPTKATPRTNEWYPAGNKYFSFTFQAYDLDRDLRDPFKDKRKVYLDRIQVESTVQSASGVAQQPYTLDAKAAKVTFDPEPVTSKYGMLITSPKGAFELRNQAIGDLAADTQGLTLTFRASVRIQRSAGSDTYLREEIRQEVPIAIFASTTPTVAAQIPVNAG